MSHDIDFSNGRANIAVVGGGKTTWHGYGNEPKDKSIAAFMEAAGFGWFAIKEAMASIDGKGLVKPVPGRFVLRRSDTDEVLGEVGSDYHAVQPAEIMEFFRNYVLADDRFELETAGCLRGGKIIWALAKFKNTIKVLGEPHVCYVFLTTSFDGSHATTAQATVVRVVCRNTVQQSLFSPRAATISIPHFRRFTDIAQADAAKQLASIAATFPAYTSMAEALHKVRISREKAAAIVEGLLNQPQLDADGKLTPKGLIYRQQTMAKFYQMFDKTIAEGAQAGTGWAAFNAITDFADHGKRVGGALDNRDATRMYSNFLGASRDMKSGGLDAIIKLADKPLALVA